MKLATVSMGEFLNYLSIPFLPVDVSWPLPNLNRSHKLWTVGSAILVPTVGVMSKVFSCWFNSFNVYNREILINALDNRPSSQPLITVSNHYSCLDDPMLWAGLLEFRHFFTPKKIRWSLAATDICFTNELHALFFSLGRTVPIVRGNGVYQKAMDFVLERLNKGEWVHIFPEGKVNMSKECLRIKWGVGRLIAESKICPVVIPLFHLGMDEVLPNTPPYYPKTNKKITVVVGEPIALEETIRELREANKNAVEQRKTISDIIQKEMWKLRDKAQTLNSSE
uniref:Tafazzin family protein n=1 Tax=Strigamia maritima TaxID=126957 RepID=T1IJL0_STRMM